jgi:hypothetical protein
MNEEYSKKGMVDIKESIYNDIKNGDFDKFLIFTYRLDPDLFEWFPPKSEIAICTNSKEISKTREHKSNFSKIRTCVLNTHAKIYLMWNSKRIKCWLGSFNFTRGIYRNIEWAAPFEGKLLCSLALEDVLFRDLSFPSDNMMINQVLSLVNSEIQRKEHVFCDNIFQNANCDLVLLHNRRTDTLSKALSRIVARSDGHVNVVYFAPYISKEGILEFCKCLSDVVKLGEVDFKIFTNKPDLSYDSDTFLKSSDIQDLKTKLRSFTLLKRKIKNGGTLIYGKNSKEHPIEISNGFIHLKLIHFSFINKDGSPEYHSIFTSANLTKKVWGGAGENFEIGLWVRNQHQNEIINSFVDRFSSCFSELDKSELDEIDKVMETIEQKNKTEEYWIENLLENRMQLNSDSITIKWEDYLPKISDVRCVLHLRNIVTGDTFAEDVCLNEKDHSFCGKITSLHSSKNIAVDYVEVILNTSFKPPEIMIKEKYIKEYISSKDKKNFLQIKRDIESNWTEVVVNKKVYPVMGETEIELPTAQIASISLRKLQNHVEEVRIFIKMKNQPILNGYFFIDTTSLLEKVNDFGELLRIDLKVNDGADPPFDTITFKDSNSNTVDYIGFSKAGFVLSYYFDPDLKELPYVAVVGAPYDAYFGNESIRLKTLTWTNKSEVDIRSVLAKNPPFLEVVGLDLENGTILDKFISEKTRVIIKMPCKLLNKFSLDQIKYYCKEDSLFYRPPRPHDLSDELSSLEPYSKVLYWAVIRVTTDREISFFTSKNSFLVRRSAIVDLPVRDKQKIPKILPLSKIGRDHPIAWIVINLDDVKLNGADENLRQKIHVEAWKNKNKLPQKVLSVMKAGRVYYIPILKREINTSIELSLVAKFEGNSLLTDYAWFMKKERYDIKAKKNDNVEIRQYDTSGSVCELIPIKNEKDSDISELYIEGTFASGDNVDKIARDDEMIKRINGNKILFLPKDDLLICLEQA